MVAYNTLIKEDSRIQYDKSMKFNYQTWYFA